MGTSIITYIKDKIKNKQNSQNNSKNSNGLNSINRAIDSIFTLKEPEIYSMSKETNIACKLDENYILTKDENIATAIEFEGISYSSSDQAQELSYLQSRVMFFNNIKSDIEINIIIKKIKKASMEDKDDGSIKLTNIYANEIIQKWTSDKDFFTIKYYFIISTISKNITGALESLKQKATTEKNETITSQNVKLSNIKESVQDVFNKLSNFKPRHMSSDELINFYATYTNAQETNLQYTHETLSDCYINSDTTFKKDYIEFYKNDGTTSYARYISIKSYETENISSAITSDMLHNKNEYMVYIHLKAYEKEKALKKIKDTASFSQDFIKNELQVLLELVKADRENLIEVSYSVYLLADSLEELEEKTNDIKSILENQGLNVVRETLNQKALYFSLFPSRGNINARKKTLKTSNIATIVNFENEITGFNRNDWGNQAVTHFRHLNGTPYLFNFHWQEFGDRPSGHTMIIGGTGAGKTTLIQFLMCNLYKYNIDIFSMDKLRGMYNFATYTDGEYHDGDENFHLNPFSLEPSKDNLEFLKNWLCLMAQVKQDEHKAINEIAETIERLYDNRQKDKAITLSNFIQSLPANEETNLRIKFKNYENSIFNNEEDALNFTKQLSIINMDNIINNPRISALCAIYIFHRLKYQAKNSTNKRGFFCFIDELKDYLNDEIMREKILEAILEVRKIGGVMCMGFQSLSLFKNTQKGSSFLDNIANYIIFPTSSQNELQEMKDIIGLTDNEISFLSSAGTNSRQVLLKMKLSNQSAILNVDLSRLGNHLKVFSSSSDNVALIKKLKQEYPHPQEWRQLYLNYKG